MRRRGIVLTAQDPCDGLRYIGCRCRPVPRHEAPGQMTPAGLSGHVHGERMGTKAGTMTLEKSSIFVSMARRA